MEPVTLEEVVENVLLSMVPTSSAKGVEVCFHPRAASATSQVLEAPEALQVLGDAGRLQQIVWNLVSNAVKFTPGGGRVEVSLESDGSHASVVVSDTGEGIAPEFLPFVFERFRQADSSSTRRHGGLGLGLAIVRHLAEMHGGSVHARSEGEGRGATFSVRLPLRPHPSVPVAESDAQSPQPQPGERGRDG
jgi:signal transduction histidine kinase